MGFRYVASGPMVRSSYKAGEFFMNAMIDEDEKADEQQQQGESDVRISFDDQDVASEEDSGQIDAAKAVAWLESKGIHAPPPRQARPWQ